MVPLITPEEVASELRSGMTIGIGGWGSRRKPMTLVRAIARAGLKDLTVVSYGGPDVGLLAALGSIRRLVFGFVSLDSIPLEPWFRKVREKGGLPDVLELDEGMFLQGLRAAAWNVPFLPTRAGLGSDVMKDGRLRTVRSPYDDAAELVAVPALKLDAALVHVHRADRDGNGWYLGPDPYMDDWFCLAADRAYVSCEKVESLPDQPLRALLNPTMVHAIVEAPGGAGFTECPPDYPRDEAAQRAYAATAKDPAAWEAWRSAWLA